MALRLVSNSFKERDYLKSVPARGRPSAPLPVHAVRLQPRPAAGEGRHLGGDRRLLPELQHPGEGEPDGPVQAVTAVRELAITPLHPTLGAEVGGIDLAAPV